jgi:bacteriophage HK97-gp10 putative tail-component
MTITVDPAPLLAALDAIPAEVHARCKAAAKITAEAIATEARARVRRRTGRTGDAIRVEETHDGTGYIIFIGDRRAHIASFLEFGTKFMTPFPFLFVAARLEERAHDQRIRDAVQGAIDAHGLGE